MEVDDAVDRGHKPEGRTGPLHVGLFDHAMGKAGGVREDRPGPRLKAGEREISHRATPTVSRA